MEDELEDRMFYQTYVSHARLLSKASLGAWMTGGGSPHCLWRLLRAYLLRYEVAALSVALLLLLLYLQAAPHRSSSLGAQSSSRKRWHENSARASAFALQGRRPSMEDRFVVLEPVPGTDVSLYAVFDGHGGALAAEFAERDLVASIAERIAEAKAAIAGRDGVEPDESPKTAARAPPSRKPSFERKSTSDDSAAKTVTDPELLARLARSRPLSREVAYESPEVEVATAPGSSYVVDGRVDYARLLADEVLAADARLLRRAKRLMDVAGATALIAVVDGSSLVVANVGDSRGVMCDSRGNAVPLSFDHKPQQQREQKRIKDAGGFIAFNGVWRVAGVLATSRALGDYPLKDKKYVVADPDVLTFDLDDCEPSFFALATDGLWDSFANEEAVEFLKTRLDEPSRGAEEVATQAYERGSADNITVLVVDLRKRREA